VSLQRPAHGVRLDQCQTSPLCYHPLDHLLYISCGCGDDQTEQQKVAIRSSIQFSSIFACEPATADQTETIAMSDQAQPVRPGDVYPPYAVGKDEARRQRDEILARDRQPQNSLRVTETDQHDGRRVITTTAGGQVRSYRPLTHGVSPSLRAWNLERR
jgi:hypothetical protein